MSDPQNKPSDGQAQAPNPDTLAIALAYLAKHPDRYLFPLPPGIKGKPTLMHGHLAASNKPDQIREWYRTRPGAGWGLSLKMSGLLAVDIDMGPGKVGRASFDALKAEGFIFPKTETQGTPSGGLHLIYKSDVFRFNNSGLIGTDIDLPNYIVIAGCVRADGKGYTIFRNNPVVSAPDWLVERIKSRASTKPRTYSGTPVPLDWLKRALAMTDYAGRHSYGEWLAFAFAVHDAACGDTGDYLAAFTDWSLADPSPDWKVETSPEFVSDKWDSITLGDEMPKDAAAITRASWFKDLPAGMLAELAALKAMAADPILADELAALNAYHVKHDKEREPERLLAKAKMDTEKKRKAELDRCENGYGLEDFLVYKPEMPAGFIHIPSGANSFWGSGAVNLSCGGPAEIDPEKVELAEDEASLAPEGVVLSSPDLYLRDKAGKIVFQSGSSAIVGNPKKRMTCMTWAPGEPQVIYNTMIRVEGGMFPKKDAHAFNRYLPPLPRYRAIKGMPIRKSAAADAKRWIDHVMLLYPDDGMRLINALAFRVQHPEIKIHHAILLGGEVGIGKDTIIEGVLHAVGFWNFYSVEAHTIMDEPKYNMWLEAVITLVQEAKDFGDENTNVGFYNRLKPSLGGTAGGIHMVRNLYVAAHPIVDVAFLIITTNHYLRGMFIPENDRRIDAMWSARTMADWGYKPTLDEKGDVIASAADNLITGYFKPLHDWYEDGGYEAIGYYLSTLDVSDYQPKAPPVHTSWWHEIVQSFRDPTVGQLTTVLEDHMDGPAAVTIDEVRAAASLHDVDLDWDAMSSRSGIQAQMVEAGYVHVSNPDNKAGHWKIGPNTARKNITVYARAKLAPKDRLAAVHAALERARVAYAKELEAKAAKGKGKVGPQYAPGPTPKSEPPSPEDLRDFGPGEQAAE